MLLDIGGVYFMDENKKEYNGFGELKEIELPSDGTEVFSYATSFTCIS